MSIHLFALLCALPLDTPASGAACAWDNEIRANGVNGRAMSPPAFPDIRVVDDFVVHENECRVSSIQIAAIEDGAWTDGGQITVTIYTDTGGEGPGAELVSVERQFTKLDSGAEYFGRDSFQYWIEVLDVDLVKGRYWLGVRNERGGGSGTNYWMTSDGGVDGVNSDIGWFSLNAGETWSPEGADWHHAFEINLNSRVGACCRDNGGCTDGVFEPRCQNRFAPGMACADLEPGFCTGACCHPDGTCDDDVSRDGCGEDRFAQGVPCAELEEPCAPTCLAVPAKKLLSVDRRENSWFGHSVAISGRTMVVGMQRQRNGTGRTAAQVYELERTGPSWQTRLLPPEQDVEDEFGWTVAIAGNPAHVIAVGAPGDDAVVPDAGAVYVFRKRGSGQEWDREGVIRVDDAEEDDYFGRAIAVWGDIIVVGHPKDDDLGEGSGSVYVFRFDGDEWPLEQKIQLPDGRESDFFGGSVDVEGDLLVVGSSADGRETNSGAVFTYRFERGQWIFGDKIFPEDGESFDGFGAVSLSGDALLVAAPGDDDNGDRAGAGYIFRYANSTWKQEAKLLPERGMPSSRLGLSRSLEGTTAVLGTRFGTTFGERTGIAYVFHRDGQGSWAETGTLLPTGQQRSSEFATSVGVFGSIVVIGSPRDGLGFDNSGSAYVFRAVSTDCNDNGIADACDIAQRRSFDRDLNGLPDECEGVCCVGDTCVESILDECEGFGCVRDPAGVCDGDVDGDGQVNPVDSGLVAAAMGSMREADLCNHDLDCDGNINPVDVGIVESLFGTCDPPRPACGAGEWHEGRECRNFDCP
jgi:hypothetical protein